MVKPVSFKDIKEKDLIEFIKDKDFSYYIKELIRNDMKKNENKEDFKSDKINKKRNVDFGM